MAITFDIAPEMLKAYKKEDIMRTLEMILKDLDNNFVEFGELSNEEYNNLSAKSKWKLDNIDKLNLIEL